MLPIIADLLEFLLDDDLLEFFFFFFAFFDNLPEFSAVFFSSWTLLYSNFWQGCQCRFWVCSNPEVLIALNSSYQSGFLLYYIVNNTASADIINNIICE